MANRSSSKTPAPRAAERARAAAAAARADAARRDRRRGRTRLLLAATAGLLLVAGAAFWASRGGGDATTTGAPAGDLAAASGQGAAVAPPWPAPNDVRARAAKAGLPLGPMGTAEHYHVHLDVLVDGKPVQVPANIGVDQANGGMSYLHTHTPDGIVHIEAGQTGQAFTLGQLFTQWDVRLTADRLGALRAGGGTSLTAYVNGTKVPGSPALLRLRPHQQVTLVYGPAGKQVDVPDSYDFPPGT